MNPNISDDLLIMIAHRGLNMKMLALNRSLAKDFPWFKRRWIAANKIKRAIWRFTFSTMYPVNFARLYLGEEIIDKNSFHIASNVMFNNPEDYRPMFCRPYGMVVINDYKSARQIAQKFYDDKNPKSDSFFAETAAHGYMTNPCLWQIAGRKLYDDTPISSNGGHALLRAPYMSNELKLRRIINQHTFMSKPAPCRNYFPTFHNIVITKIYIESTIPLDHIDIKLGGRLYRRVTLREYRVENGSAISTYNYQSKNHIAIICGEYQSLEFDIRDAMLTYEYAIYPNQNAIKDMQIINNNSVLTSNGLVGLMRDY